MPAKPMSLNVEQHYHDRAAASPAPVRAPAVHDGGMFEGQDELSPEDQWHGPYEVARHPQTGAFHVLDNAGRLANYGWNHRGGYGDQATAEKMRDGIDERGRAKEQAHGIADKLWNGMHNTHEAIHVMQYHNGQEHRPFYGPEEAHRDLHNFVNDKESGAADYIAQDDPRIRRWQRQQRNGSLFARESDLSWEGDIDTTAAKGPTKAEQFFQANPVHPDHIIAHWSAATPAEKDTGEHWYESAHHLATAIAGGDSALGAGMVANYSGQTGLATNMHSASRSLRAGRGLTGAKNHPGYTKGLFASGKQADAADRLLAGEHHSDVITSPKISNFAHLIEDPENHDGRVVVDRHALSVAVGHRVTDKEFSSASLSAKPRKGESVNRNYSLVADAYRVAADKISQIEGRPIAPHQVQAVTWDVRRRLNDADSDANDPKVKGRRQLAKNEQARWQQHVQDLYPEHVDNPHFKLSHLRREASYDHRVTNPEQLMQRPAGEGSIWPVQAQVHDRATGARLGYMTPSTLCEHHLGQLGMQIDSHNETQTEHPHTYRLMHDTWPVGPQGHGSCAACINHAIDDAFTATGLRRVAYGETYVPQAVDTLRNPECPICGNSNSFRGRACMVCGYVQPPAPFGDPDVEKATELNDLRRSIQDDVGTVDPSRPDDDTDDEPVATIGGSE